MKISNGKYFILSGNEFNQKAMAIANAMAIELMNYHVYTTRDLLREISYTDTKTAMKFCSGILKDYTVGKLNRPLFTNWESRTEFTFDEQLIQILGYLVKLDGNDLYDPSYMENLLVEVPVRLENGAVSLASINEAKSLFYELASSKVALDRARLNTLIDLAQIFYADNNFSKRIYSDEARISVLLGLVAAGRDLGVSLALLKCKPADALRYTAALLDINGIKLPSDVRYAPLTWKQRIALLGFLNSFSYEQLFEDTGINRAAWTRFYKHIHLFQQKDFINRFKTIGFVARVSVGSKEEVIPKQYFKVLDKFLDEGVVESLDTERLVYRTFASRIQTAINKQDFNKIETLMESNGGYLLRNLAAVSNGVTNENAQRFIALVKSKLSTATVDVLFSILSINVDAEYRIIDIKGNTVVEEANYPAFIADIQGDIRAELSRRYGISGQIAVSNELKDKVVPFLSKNSELDRGTSIKIKDSKNLYMFVHWVEGKHRTDLDLSVVAFDKDWKPTTIYFGNQANKYISHSGDITSAPAPHGATEYVRINLSLVPKDVCYILPIINVFSGDVFRDNTEVYAGFAFSDSDIFVIEQEHVRYDLVEPAISNIPFMLDFYNKDLVILDFNNRVQYGLTAHSEIVTMRKLISAALDKNVMTIGKVAEILSGSSDATEYSIVKTAKTGCEIEPNQLVDFFSDKV